MRMCQSVVVDTRVSAYETLQSNFFGIEVEYHSL